MNSNSDFVAFFNRLRNFAYQNEADYFAQLGRFLERVRRELPTLIGDVTPTTNVIAGFQQFFARLGKYETDTKAKSSIAFADFFQRVRPKLNGLLEAVRQEETELAPRFNIFSALHIERKETILHTPMLAHLLNPSSTHGQGVVFLRSFVDMVRKHPCTIPPDETPS